MFCLILDRLNLCFPTDLFTRSMIHPFLNNGADIIITTVESSLPRSPTLSDSSTPLRNGRSSPLADDMTLAGKAHDESESELSNTEPPSRLSNLPREDLNQTSTPSSRASESSLTDTASDQDAEGDEDADYDMETPPIVATATPINEPSSSSSPARVSKRKLSSAEDDFMRENPELYGLRRSVRLPQSPT